MQVAEDLGCKNVHIILWFGTNVCDDQLALGNKDLCSNSAAGRHVTSRY